MKRKVLLSFGVAIMASAAFAAEDARVDVRAKEDAARAAQQGAVNSAHVNEQLSSNDRYAVANEVSKGQSPASKLAAQIIAGQSHADLPAENVGAFASAIRANMEAGMDADSALNQELQKRGSNLSDFADKDKGCGE